MYAADFFFSVSETEVVIEVPRGGQAWGQTSLENEGSAAIFYSLQRQQQQQGKDMQGIVLLCRPLLHQGLADNTRGATAGQKP